LGPLLTMIMMELPIELEGGATKGKEWEEELGREEALMTLPTKEGEWIATMDNPSHNKKPAQ